MKKIILLIFCLLLCSCADSDPLGHFKCTDDQYDMVERQTKFCNDNTDYLGSYCYKTALKNNCKVTKL